MDYVFQPLNESTKQRYLNYEKDGLKILVCGTCLNHFNFMERKQVGETTNILDIITAMLLADKVVSI